MTALKKTTLLAILANVVKGSFMDFNFGPDFHTSGDDETRLMMQENKHELDDYNGIEGGGGFTKIPSKDYIDDLEYGPLFAGIVSFAHLPVIDCVKPNDNDFDIAIVGAPFDTGVSYRPGARFGPSGIREGSRRMAPGTYSPYHPDFDPLLEQKIVDCGDIPMTPFDNRIALDQLYRGHRAVLTHSTSELSKKKKGKSPKIVSLGGDHTITFSALRAVHEIHGQVSVLHFDSHIDTWDPIALGGNVSSYSQLNHGTFLHYAHEKGYIEEDSSMHVGVRAPYVRKHKDQENDKRCGFETVLLREIDQIGVSGIANKIKQRIGDRKVYISVDIDVLDPAYAPATGTAEVGGFTTREFLTLLDQIEGLNVVGADLVEVAPAYDTAGQTTLLAASEIVNSLISLIEHSD